MTAREIIDAGRYMVLGTADEQGRPWALVPSGTRPTATAGFLLGLACRRRGTRATSLSGPELSIVIFDSSAPIGTGEGVYMDAVARAARRDAGSRSGYRAVFSRRSLGQGGSAWTVAGRAARPPSCAYYRATATEQWLGERDRRTAVSL